MHLYLKVYSRHSFEKKPRWKGFCEIG